MPRLAGTVHSLQRKGMLCFMLNAGILQKLIWQIILSKQNTGLIEEANFWRIWIWSISTFIFLVPMFLDFCKSEALKSNKMHLYWLLVTICHFLNSWEDYVKLTGLHAYKKAKLEKTMIYCVFFFCDHKIIGAVSTQELSRDGGPYIRRKYYPLQCKIT